MSQGQPKRPLEGIVVLDLSRLLPGPYLTMVLADMGADVIKIEDPRIGDYMRQLPPTRGGMSGRFLAVNRDKRSATLDLKSDAGRQAFLKMAARADVVVESFRPGVMTKLGVDYDALRKVNDKIILCSISGYGQTGPYVKRAGHDLNYIGLAGVLAMGGDRGGFPKLPGVQIADLAGGALWGATAVLGALVGRDRGAGGAHLDISMTEGAMALLAAEVGAMDASGEQPTRGTTELNGRLACYGVYRTSDDRYLSVGALEPKFWVQFNAAIGRKGDMADVIAPIERQEEIRAEIQGIIGGKTFAEWSEILSGFDACAEPILELNELPEHPLHKEREVFFRTSEDGVLQMRTPVGQPVGERAAPTLGQHTQEVLEQFGFSAAEIEELGEAPS
jgi:crotonobetainyl-CoA:carnitine CoA-transferase CaiB-like acyl-CoA transferase